MTRAPWAVGAGELDALERAGVTDEGIVQAVTIAAVFNHLTRVADGTGMEPDYPSPLRRIAVDRSIEPAELPPGEAPAGRSGRPGLTLDLRPKTKEALGAWRAYARSGSEGLSARHRAILGREVASRLGDDRGAASWEPVATATPAEVALVRYAAKLTAAPWRVGEGDLHELRGLGWDDRGLLDIIAVVGFQNMESRLRLALAESGYPL